MNAVLLIGLQGAGKSTFYERFFANTHLRVSRDLVNTKPREHRLIESCLVAKRDFVIDNTNPTIAHRAPSIGLIKAAGYHLAGYYFVPDIKACLARNALRLGKAKIPIPGIYRTHKILQPPTYSERFDKLYEVKLLGENFEMVELARD